ncbi:hypothetical protein [Azospirillum sp. INR13]|uniref:hypothetical protein n=1 Tax=Azospirillum sp. INR13 TaxID=2596919 RepID=UPI002104A45B|nr:hypothetical protein [Azospirillum sp. INR13]
MDLTQRRGGGGRVLETLEARLPAWTKFARHPPLDEGPAHRRRVGLKLRQFLGVFLRQGVGDGGQDLRHLHQRPLQPAECGPQFRGVAFALHADSQHALARQARGQPANGGADPRISRDPSAPCVLIVFRHAHKVGAAPAKGQPSPDRRLPTDVPRMVLRRNVRFS